MKSTLVALAGIILLTASSCSKHRLKGEGPDTSDTRAVAAFTHVKAIGSTNVTIIKDSDYRVVVTGRQNLVPAYETEVSGGVLRLQFDEKYINIKNNNVRVEVYTPDIAIVSLNGSGNVDVNGAFTNDLKCEINGSGEMVVRDGVFSNFTADINGSGSIKASSSECEHGHTKISGSGDIEIRANKSLSGRISGSGNVYYWGSPEVVDINISGSGNVIKKG